MRIFTVPPDVPFCDALARAILAGGFPEPGRPAPEAAALAHWRVYLPTRRAKAALADTFMRQSRGARLLPKSIAISTAPTCQLPSANSSAVSCSRS